MIPNCKGCIEELYIAHEFQEEGCDVVLENMGLKNIVTLLLLILKQENGLQG